MKSGCPDTKIGNAGSVEEAKATLEGHQVNVPFVEQLGKLAEGYGLIGRSFYNSIDGRKGFTPTAGYSLSG